jgi:hypothetical protein
MHPSVHTDPGPEANSTNLVKLGSPRSARLVGALVCFGSLALLVVACNPRSLAVPDPREERTEVRTYPQSLEKEVDLLFVIDNSDSMNPHQANLRANFSKLMEALRSDKLGGKIPSVRIGIVSTDVGVGVGGLGSIGCTKDGDDGRLVRQNKQTLCPMLPKDGWISYDLDSNTTNLQGCSGDPMTCVMQAFTCLANLGTGGCGFEQPLEAARRALDPKQGRNPGFLRAEALLAVVFITDEDDCSTRTPTLLSAPSGGHLGPQKSFRCFNYGFDCQQKGSDGVSKDNQALGLRAACKENDKYLRSTKQYIEFFKGIKSAPDRVIMASIAGPTTAVEVTTDKDGHAYLGPACLIDKVSPSTGRLAGGAPALRISAVVEAFGGQQTEICRDNFGPALAALGDKIVASLGDQCIHAPLLLSDGAVACKAGVDSCRAPSCEPTESCDEAAGFCVTSAGELTTKRCGLSCLDAVDCLVEELVTVVDAQGKRLEQLTPLERCPREIFLDTTLPADGCGAHCPCWRVVPRGEACTKAGDSPFGFEVMRKTEPPKGARIRTLCRTATYPWGDDRVQNALQHCVVGKAAGAQVGS